MTRVIVMGVSTFLLYYLILKGVTHVIIDSR